LGVYSDTNLKSFIFVILANAGTRRFLNFESLDLTNFVDFTGLIDFLFIPAAGNARPYDRK